MATATSERRRFAACLAVALGLAACAGPEDDEPELPDVPEIAYCDPVRDWDPALAEREDEVLTLINERRAAGTSCGDEDFAPTDPLIMDPALRCAARIHALDMGAQDYFSNLDPDGLGYVDRTELAGYAGTPLHQLIGARQSTAAQTVDAIFGSTAVCAKAMDPEATQVGIGHGPDTDAALVRYWTQVFGHD